MYVPAAFAEADTAKLHDFMRRQSFAVLTSNGGGGLVASHLPLLLDREAGPRGHLLGHMARANPQWRGVEGEAMAVFSGPHAYVSPSWYEEEGTVPTWNYVAVHAYGSFHVVEGRDALLDILRRSVTTYEGRGPEPWSFDESASHVEAMLRAIVGFRIEISRLEGKWKLSQNQPEDRSEDGHAGLVRTIERGFAGDRRDDERSLALTAFHREPRSRSPRSAQTRDPSRHPDDSVEGQQSQSSRDLVFIGAGLSPARPPHDGGHNAASAKVQA